MNEFDMQNTTRRNSNDTLEALCQEFNGISFYGLEYILEDFFQMKGTQSANLTSAAVDWFGLYD
ncbi:MAG: hypothetical protein ACR65R_17240 [Methylomicrobium sp.]